MLTEKERTILVANRLLDELRAIGAEHEGQPGWDGHELVLGVVAALRSVCNNFGISVDEVLAEVQWVKNSARPLM
jgi:hypothetical protein